MQTSRLSASLSSPSPSCMASSRCSADLVALVLSYSRRMDSMQTRPIRPGDNLTLATIIRETFREFQTARQFGYRQVYIETVPEFGKAISLYEKCGFRHLDGAKGNTGHAERMDQKRATINQAFFDSGG